MREAVVLCEWEDLSLAEAAVVMNTTAKAVESRLNRARNLLRERLKKWL
jgi:RNA polymerase sigma-70 factor (ECF subfamily)